MADCDTLECIPQQARSLEFLNQLLVENLKSHVGIIVAGVTSPSYPTEACWGPSIKLSSGEDLQLRVYPKGVMGASAVGKVSGFVMLATRRWHPTSAAEVAFAVLWNPNYSSEMGMSVESLVNCSGMTVAARYLHLIAPSLFHHHDPALGATEKSQRPSIPIWPTTDEAFYHAVRPSSFSITQGVVMARNERRLYTSAATGSSQWVIAGALAGVEVQDHVKRASEPISSRDWMNMNRDYASQLENKVGRDATLKALCNSMLVMDLMSAEGVIALLCQNFVEGAMPDMLHSPGGFPLLICFAMRLACRPEFFGLSSGSQEDQVACKELISMFESNWTPISDVKWMGNSMYAIDLAMRVAWKEAVSEARGACTGPAVNDNLTFWQRAGQRCVFTIFGIEGRNSVQRSSRLPRSERVFDPMEEAVQSLLQNEEEKAGKGFEGIKGAFADVAQASKCNNALRMMDSVETWLREGIYAGMQINRVNSRAASRRPVAPRKVLKALNEGMEQSVKEMVESGDAENELEARARAEELRTRVSQWLETAGETGNLPPFGSGEDSEEEEQMASRADRLHALGVDDADGIPLDHLDPDKVCMDAFRSATSCIAAGMCQGPLVHNQFGMATFLCYKNAINTCADCDSTIHVLSACFLTTRFGSCSRCRRARCMSCAEALSRKTEKEASLVKGCKRCRDAEQKARSGRS